MPRRPPTKPRLPRGRLGSRLLRPLAEAAPTLLDLLDNAAAGDAVAVTAAASQADSGGAADNLAVVALVPLAEAGAGTELLAVPVVKTLTDSGTGAEHLCHDGGPVGAPDCILVADNLAGPLTFLWDDPTAPDANWLAAVDPGAPTGLRVSFPTPTLPPGSGGPLQFQTVVRKVATAPDLPVVVQLWEAGVFVKTLTEATVTSTSGQLVTATLTPADLTSPDGSQVELVVATPDDTYSDGY